MFHHLSALSGFSLSGFSLDPKFRIQKILDALSLDFSGVPEIEIAAATVWPLMQSLSRIPPWLPLVVLIPALYWSTRSLKLTLIAGLLFAFALLGEQNSFGQESFWLAVFTLIPGLLSGLLLGYLHAAYVWVRPLTWTCLWVILALPLIAIAAIAVGALAPNRFSIELWAVAGAPMGVMARSAAVALEHIDPELRRQARRLGATQAIQVRLLSFHLSVPSLRAGLHQAIMVFFFTSVALGAVGLPGMGREIWLSMKAGNLADVIYVGAKIWSLAIALDILLQLRGRGRLVRMMEA